MEIIEIRHFNGMDALGDFKINTVTVSLPARNIHHLDGLIAKVNLNLAKQKQKYQYLHFAHQYYYNSNNY